jgi:hypothetical protein
MGYAVAPAILIKAAQSLYRLTTSEVSAWEAPGVGEPKASGRTGYRYSGRPQLPPLYPAKHRQTGPLGSPGEHPG